MAKKKTSRKELLKGPDEFITFSSKVVDFIRIYQRQLSYLGFAIVAVVILFFAVYLWMGHVNKMGQTAYNTAAGDMMNWMMKSDPDPASLQKAGESFSDVIDNHNMSKAARLALPLAAHIKFLEKNYDEAIVLYLDFMDKFAGDTQYESLARLALAFCYEAKKELNTAIETLNPLVENDSDCPFREIAMWQLARLYKLDNKTEKAEEILTEFVEKYMDSPFYAMAKASL